MKSLQFITLFTVLIFSLINVNPQKSKQLTVPNLKPISNATIKVALLLDTSNSMDGLIDQAKSKLWSIVNELANAKCEHETPNLEIALYEYGNDGLEKSDNYIRQVLNFSADLDKISERLFSLHTNGGSEYCGAVIQKSIVDLKWGKQKNDLNLLFIAGNEPFTQGNVSYIDAIADAKEKDITVNTIFCGDYNNGIRSNWKKGAVLGNGEYMNINQNKHIIHIVTPYDDIILQLNNQLNDTHIYYGKSGYKKSQRQSKQDQNAYNISSEIAVTRAISKTKSMYNNAQWDLVDAVKNNHKTIDNIDKSSLPEKYKNKTAKQLKEIVSKLESERKKIKKEIQINDAKRRSYIAKKSNRNTKDELESVMINAIKNQAKLKNYSW